MQFRELSVKRQLLVIDGTVRLGPPKSAAGVRTLALDEFQPQSRPHRTRGPGRRRPAVALPDVDAFDVVVAKCLARILQYSALLATGT